MQAGLRSTKKNPDREGELRWPDLMRRVNWLIEAGVLPLKKRERWDDLRDLRNETTHMSIRHVMTPHEVLRVLDWPARSTLYSLPRPAATQTRPSREIAGEIVAPSATPDNVKRRCVGWAFCDAGGGTRTPDTRIMIPLL